MTAFIPSPSTNAIHIDIGSVHLSLHMYGLMLAIGVLVAYRVAEWRYARMDRDPADIASISVVVVICGVVGARVYHLFTGYKWEQEGVLGAFKIWNGGLSIWGAVAGGAIGVVVMCWRKHYDVFAVCDALAPGIILAQAIGRWGNWFNQELYGRPTTLPWALKIDPAHRPINYLDRATFHPTFLYESIWCLLVFGVLMWAQRYRPLRKGQTFTLYVSMYTFGRVFFEWLRVDPASKILGVRFNLMLSAVLCVGFGIWFVMLGRRPESEIAFPKFRPAAVPAASELEPAIAAEAQPEPAADAEPAPEAEADAAP